MYHTAIKEKYRKDFTGFWQTDKAGREYAVLMTMGNMSLLYSEDTHLLLDIFNNKLEVFKTIDGVQKTIKVEAKNVDYADRFDLHGTFQIVGFDNEGSGPVLLKVKGIDETNRNATRLILPSRLRVVSIE